MVQRLSLSGGLEEKADSLLGALGGSFQVEAPTYLQGFAHVTLVGANGVTVTLWDTAAGLEVHQHDETDAALGTELRASEMDDLDLVRTTWRHSKSDGQTYELTADLCQDHRASLAGRRWIVREEPITGRRCTFCAGFPYVATQLVGEEG